MDAAWPRSTGEAIHTSTFLGHPVGCAMALAQIQEIQARRLPERSAALGAFLLRELRATISAAAPGRLKFAASASWPAWKSAGRTARPPPARLWRVVREMLRAGFIVLPEGEHSNIISFTPPLTITRAQLAAAARAFAQALKSLPAT